MLKVLIVIHQITLGIPTIVLGGGTLILFDAVYEQRCIARGGTIDDSGSARYCIPRRTEEGDTAIIGEGRPA